MKVTTFSLNILSDENSLSALGIHGYGGNKEEMLGLSFAIAEAGINTYTIDLRGQGENVHLYSHQTSQETVKFVGVRAR